MNRISTEDLENLPHHARLQQICRSIAAIEAIVCPEWEYRYYSYQKNWDDNEEVCQMKNGEGDQMLLLFRPEGTCINGFAHESALNGWKQVQAETNTSFLKRIFGLGTATKTQLTQQLPTGMFDGLPATFEEFIFGEPVKSIGTTFCIWQMNGDNAWKRGNVELPQDNLKDGSLDLLQLLDGKAETYCNWAETHYEIELDIEAIRQILEGTTITKKLVERLNPNLENYEKLNHDLDEIGYEVDLK